MLQVLQSCTWFLSWVPDLIQGLLTFMATSFCIYLYQCLWILNTPEISDGELRVWGWGTRLTLCIMTSFEKLKRHCAQVLYAGLHLYTPPTHGRYSRAGPGGHVAIAVRKLLQRVHLLYSSHLRSNRQAHLVATGSLVCLHLVTYVVCGHKQPQ